MLRLRQTINVSRCISNFLMRTFSTLPEHTQLTMPALSPTMEIGSISEWLLKEGDEITAGSVMAQVETDKAIVDFEAQDEGYIARLFVESGTSDIPVGSVVGIIVEERDDIAAFKDMERPSDETEGEVESESPTETTTHVTTTSTQSSGSLDASSIAVKTPTTTTTTSTSPIASSTQDSANRQPEVKVAQTVVTSTTSPSIPRTTAPTTATPLSFERWGSRVLDSPLSTTLSKFQIDYQAKYGSTLQGMYNPTTSAESAPQQ